MSNCELTPHRFRIFALWFRDNISYHQEAMRSAPYTQTQFINLKNEDTMILYTLKKYVNEKLSAAYGKFFAYPVVTQTYGLDELAEHMSKHNTPFSKGAIMGMLTDMVSCVRELVLQGIAVKIPDLAIFSIGIKNKEGAASEKEFTITKNIAGLKLRARGTGEFKASSLNLDASLKKATAVTGEVIPPDDGKDNTGDTTQGGGTNQGGDSTQTGGSDNTESGGSDGGGNMG